MRQLGVAKPTRTTRQRCTADGRHHRLVACVPCLSIHPGAWRCAAAAHLSNLADANEVPDVMPHVLLALEPVWHSSSSTSTSIPSNGPRNTVQPELQHQQEQQDGFYLLPRTAVRLQGMHLPGFIPRLTPREDPQVTLWKQQSALAWRTAAIWAKQQHHQLQRTQQQALQPQPSSQQQPQASATVQQQPSAESIWLQRLLSKGTGHWGTAAAVVDAAGPLLQLQHLLQLMHALADITASSAHSNSSSKWPGSDDSTADLFRPSVLAIELAPQQQTTIRHNNSNSSNDGSSGSVRVLKCADLLPQLSVLLLRHLQPPQQQREQQQGSASEQAPGPAAAGSDSSSSSESGAYGTSICPLNTSTAVLLLQQLAQLHTSSKFGTADSELVAELVTEQIILQQCSLSELAAAIHSCGQLGHPHRTSWLAGIIDVALEKLQQQQQQERNQKVAAAVAQLLDGLSMYPGPHINPKQLEPFLTHLQPHLSTLTPVQSHQLLTSAASLAIMPSQRCFEAAATAAENSFNSSSFRELVLLLQGVTAVAQLDIRSYKLDEAWWQSWFEVTASRCAAATLAHAAANAAAGDGKQGSSSGGSSLAAAALRWNAPVGSTSSKDQTALRDLGDSSWADDGVLGTVQANSDSAEQQQEQQQQEVVAAEVLFDALLVLLQVGHPVHPLWLAGALEAYQRSGYVASSTPQLLLLVSDLLDNPPGFAVRHKTLMNQLMQPLAQSLVELNPEQLAQAVEVCSVFNFGPGVDWFRWHSAAVLRLNTTFPLQPLARVADAYKQLQQVPDDHRLQQLFKSVPWRLKRQERREQAEKKYEALRATITFKNEQRRRQNLRDREALEKKKVKWQQRDAKKWGVGGSGGPGGGAASANLGLGPAGREEWRTRKLKPPGTLDRKF